MDVLLLTTPDDSEVEVAADALARALDARGKQVARGPDGSGDIAVLAWRLDDALALGAELGAHDVRAFMLVQDEPDSLSALPEAARRARTAREAGHRFKVDHWVLTGARSERSVWEFEHHCDPCRLDWAVSSETADYDSWAQQVIDELRLAPKAQAPTAAIPMPAKLGFPGVGPSAEASKFTYVFDARELGGQSGDVVAIPGPGPRPVVQPSVPPLANGVPRRLPLLVGAAVALATLAGAMILL
jgi:hypothetical protein